MRENLVAFEIAKAWGAHPRLRFWRTNAGVGWFANGQPARKGDPGARPVRFGVKGQGDYSGIIRPGGRRLEIETKSTTGEQREAQERFQAMVEAMGGVYVLAHSLAEFDAAMAALGITR